MYSYWRFPPSHGGETPFNYWVPPGFPPHHRYQHNHHLEALVRRITEDYLEERHHARGGRRPRQDGNPQEERPYASRARRPWEDGDEDTYDEIPYASRARRPWEGGNENPGPHRHHRELHPDPGHLERVVIDIVEAYLEERRHHHHRGKPRGDGPPPRGPCCKGKPRFEAPDEENRCFYPENKFDNEEPVPRDEEAVRRPWDDFGRRARCCCSPREGWQRGAPGGSCRRRRRVKDEEEIRKDEVRKEEVEQREQSKDDEDRELSSEFEDLDASFEAPNN